MSTSSPSEMQIWSQVVKKRPVGSVSRKQTLGGLHPETQKICEDLMVENTKTEMMQEMMMQMQTQVAYLTSQVGEVLQRKSKSANTESYLSYADASEFRI